MELPGAMDVNEYVYLCWHPTGFRHTGCVYVVPKRYRQKAEKCLAALVAEDRASSAPGFDRSTYEVLASYREAVRLVSSAQGVIWAITRGNKAKTGGVASWVDCLAASMDLYA